MTQYWVNDKKREWWKPFLANFVIFGLPILTGILFYCLNFFVLQIQAGIDHEHWWGINSTSMFLGITAGIISLPVVAAIYYWCNLEEWLDW